MLMLYKSQISDGITRMPSSNKHFIWIKLNSDFFDLEEDIFVCGLYIPPSNSEYFKNQDIDLFDQLKSDLVKYNSKGQIIIIGDLNARLGSSQENFSYVNDNPDDLSYVDDIDSLPVRCLIDTKSNQSGRKLIKLLNECSLISLNGRKIGDTSGKLTCHQYNGSSTVDLSIVSWDLYEKVQFFKVLDPVWFSDHCPVKMSLTIGHSVDENPINRSEFVELDETFQWSEEGSYKFSEMLNSEHIQKRLQEEVIDKCKTDANDPNIAVVNFNNIIQDISRDCLSPKSKIYTKDNVKNRNKWISLVLRQKKNLTKKRKNLSNSPITWEGG